MLLLLSEITSTVKYKLINSRKSLWCNEKLLFYVSKIRTLKDLVVLSESVNCLNSRKKQLGRKSFTENVTIALLFIVKC